MPASISSVVSRGYGSWAGVNLLPTWGYGIGVTVAVSLTASVLHVLNGSNSNLYPLAGTSNGMHPLDGPTTELHRP